MYVWKFGLKFLFLKLIHEDMYVCIYVYTLSFAWITNQYNSFTSAPQTDILGSAIAYETQGWLLQCLFMLSTRASLCAGQGVQMNPLT